MRPSAVVGLFVFLSIFSASTSSSQEYDLSDQDTLLAVAARDGDVATIRKLIAEGYPLNATMEKWTPLMLAVMNGELEIVRELLDAGADPDISHEDYGNAVAIAAMSPIYPVEGETAILDLLIEYGARVDIGNGAQMSALMFAAREGKRESVDYLLRNGADAFHSDARGWTPLLFAVRSGDPDIVNLILDMGVNPDPQQEYPRSTPLYTAVSDQNVTIVQQLLDAGADPDGLFMGPFALAAPITQAAALDNLQIVSLLLKKGANPNVNAVGFVPLNYVDYDDDSEGEDESVDGDVEEGEDDWSDDGETSLSNEGSEEDEEDPYSMTRTALDWAILNDNHDMIELLEKAGGLQQSDIDRAIEKVIEALMEGSAADLGQALQATIPWAKTYHSTIEDPGFLTLAMDRGEGEILEELLDHVSFESWTIELAYNAAYDMEKPELIDILFDHQPGETGYAILNTHDGDALTAAIAAHPELLNFRDDEQNTLLHYATSDGATHLVQILLDAGLAPDLTNFYGETPFYNSVRIDDVETLELLIEKAGTLPLTVNSSGISLMSAAARAGAVNALRLVLQYDSDVESRDTFGWMPLHHAIWGGAFDAVQLLLEHGAPYAARTYDGQSALDLAREYGSTDMEQLILQYSLDR